MEAYSVVTCDVSERERVGVTGIQSITKVKADFAL